MKKRMIRIFCLFCGLFCMVFVRTGSLSTDLSLEAVSARQSSKTLSVTPTRGMIYDTKMRPLVNNEQQLFAAVAPCDQNKEAVWSDGRFLSDAATRAEQWSNGTPFLTPVSDSVDDLVQTATLTQTVRYGTQSCAPHIIGYINSDGVGMTGIEQAYDELLSGYGADSVSFTLDARSNPILGILPDRTLSEEAVEGVVLTIDRRLQTIVEEVGSRMLTKGAVVLMEAGTGKLRACASFPTFDPNNVEDAMADEEGAPLLNRAFSSYSVGSTFKSAVAAAALTQGVSLPADFCCTGSITVGDTVFHCFHREGQGVLDFQNAMAGSCNPYFISIGQQLSPYGLRAMAEDLSFGKPTVFAPGFSSDDGTLPAVQTLENKGQLANFSFGQGQFAATPVQLAQMMNAFVSGGAMTPASLVEGTTVSGKLVDTPADDPVPTQAMRKETADAVKEALVYTVMGVESHAARPKVVSAGGKTGTAQTGRFHENGEEIVEGWFVGFFPAENPTYVMAVLCEDAQNGAKDASNTFREIVDQMTYRPPQE